LFRNWRKGRDNFLNAKNKIGKNRKTGVKNEEPNRENGGLVLFR